MRPDPRLSGSGDSAKMMYLLALVVLLLLLLGVVDGHRHAPDIQECPALGPRRSPAKDVTDLRPDDIKVVMALGDSVTAAFGAKLITFLDAKILQEYRGLSFSMGGDAHAPTIANFIRHYQPELVGSSRGSHLIELCLNGVFCAPDELAYRPYKDVFNAALSGAISATLGLETKYLLKQVTHHPAVNVTGDWKMLTFFIGTNELCKTSCEAPPATGKAAPDYAAEFEQRVVNTLLILKSRLPRLVVNMLLLPDMSQVEQFATTHPRCIHARQLLSTICPCALAHGETGRWAMRRMTAEYNRRLVLIARRINAQARREAAAEGRPWDFAILVSPTLQNLDIRNDIPPHFAGKLDCFHPSATAHRSLAMGVWYAAAGHHPTLPYPLTPHLVGATYSDAFRNATRTSWNRKRFIALLRRIAFKSTGNKPKCILILESIVVSPLALLPA